MRHVILGSDTPMGSSILRVLVSLVDQEIVCCNPDGIIPADVPTTNIITFNVDIRKKNMLSAILKKDDIIYNAQLLDDEDLISINFFDLHVQGLINLLKIGNEKKVKKIISYLPQKITWDVPLNADEDTILIPTTNYQKSLVKTLSVAEKYIEDKNYDLLKLENENPASIENRSIDFDETEDPDNVNKTEENDNDQSISNEKQSLTNPTIDDDNSKEIELSKLSPALDSNVSNETENNLEIQHETNMDNPSLEKENHSYNEKAIENINSTSEVEKEMPKLETSVPLVIARMARFFGPFDEGLTKSYCKAIRLQRIKVVGKLKNKISWINPLDAGRAMIKMVDDKVLQNQYNIIGFNATVMELLDELGKVNYSKTKIRKKIYFIQSIIIKIKSKLIKLRIFKRINYEEVYGRNKTQIYSDTKALKLWGWKPKYDLKTTSKDALNWYVNHIL